MEDLKADAEYLFEASWEVCNKVGGINTVLKSKAILMKKYYKNYVLIGPYFKKNAELELAAADPPPEYRKAIDDLKAQGIYCTYGNWLIKGEPNVILIDFQSLAQKKNEIKGKLWEQFKVDSLFASWEYEEPMLWAYATGMLLEKIGRELPGSKIIAQFHEWLAGFGLLYLKSQESHIRTVFTTHATILGRSIAEGGGDLYSMIETIQPEQEAKLKGVMDKFTAERAAAQNADVFTTVSEITGIEAEKILGRKPEVLVLNGLDVDKFPTIEETSIKHHENLELVKEYITYHFFPYYTFDLEHTIVFFMVSRYEFKNKGIDVLIKALGRLNEQLQKENSEKTVVVFFWVPNRTHGLKTELLENKNIYRHIKQYIDLKSKDILNTIVEGIISQDTEIKERIFTKEFMRDMKKEFLSFRRVGNPAMATHNLDSEEHDAIISTLLSVGIDNKPNDRVKAVVYPVYLDGNDGLLNLSYYDAMAGCQLGIFPSYYEPWGYTPVESAAMGVAAITTDLSGFGMFIEPKLLDQYPGIYILKRYKKTEEEAIRELASIMHLYALYDHAERVQNKINAKNLSFLTDWKHLVKNYIMAHNMALHRQTAREQKPAAAQAGQPAASAVQPPITQASQPAAPAAQPPAQPNQPAPPA